MFAEIAKGNVPASVHPVAAIAVDKEIAYGAKTTTVTQARTALACSSPRHRRVGKLSAPLAITVLQRIVAIPRRFQKRWLSPYE